MKFLLASILTLSFSQAFAQYETVSCDSIRGTGNMMLLVIANKELKQVRVSVGGSMPRALLINRIHGQSIPDVTLYTVSGSSELLEIQNSVLDGIGGYVKLAGDELSCF
ncbi:MAG: hypothetical protein K2P81_09185 [Bacteriovoracaceae bacterium]|nr:hypothetical protein [Bacteriovoracaceae bacterium]